jgi:amino acid adenylation domain-containing protein
MFASTTQNPLSSEPVLGDGQKCPERNRAFACVHRCFEEQAARLPDALALVDGSVSITLRELDVRASQLAGLLHARGIGTGSKVAIAIPRSIDAVISVLACLKSGAAYVPIGTTYPERLISYILEDSDVDLILCRGALQLSSRAAIVRVDELEPDLTGQNGPSSDWPGDSLACVLYTSGSSGRPKGVRITHRGIVQRCEALWTLQPFASGEHAIQNTALTVVDSFWELWAPLCQGIPVLLLDDAASQDLPRFVSALQAHQVTRICLVPSLLRSLLTTEHDLERRLEHLRHWVVSGEPLAGDLVSLFYEQLPHATLFNQYGLTESSADVTSYDTRALVARSTESGPVPVGAPFPGVELFVLDDQLDRVPDGEDGELYLGGDCLADGYLNMPALTAERFLPNPFSSSGRRMLRTGDRARRLATGQFLVTGRGDRQVKVRGYRVELDGLESVITGHPAVGAAAVVCRSSGAGDMQLIAYVSSRTEVAPTPAELRAYCADHAPAYMIPHRFVVVGDMPRTPSGKIDRNALPALATETVSIADRPDLPALQDEVRRLWCQLLGAPDVGVDEEFFRAGGDSLLMMKMLGEVRNRLGRDISVKHFVARPTLEGLHELIRSAKRTETGPAASSFSRAIEAFLKDSSTRARGHRAPASLPQTSIWMHEQMAYDGNPYGITVSATLSGALDTSLLRSACQAVVHAEPALTTRFFMSAAGLEQCVTPDDRVRFEVLEGRNIPVEQKQQYIDNHIRRVASRRLNVSREAPVVIRVVALTENEFILIIQVHHMVCDGLSVKVLLKKLAGTYNALAKGTPPTSMPDYRFLAYCDWEHGMFSDDQARQRSKLTEGGASTVSRALRYWEDAVPELERSQPLPSDYPNRTDPSFEGGEVVVDIERGRVGNYLDQIRKRGVTPFHLFFAAYSKALFRTFKYERQAIGFTNSMRPAEFDDALGCYITTLPCLLRVSEFTTGPELLEQVSDSLWNAVESKHVPFEVVLDHLRAKGRATDFRGFQTVVSFDDWAIEHLELHGLDVQPQRVNSRWSKFPISLNIEVTRSRFMFLFEYRTNLYREATIGLLARTFLDELERFALCC